MKRILVLFLSIFSLANLNAQIPRTYTSSEILQQIKKLKVLGTVLYMAAHPDDENTRLIAYLANDKLYRTGYLSVTRGDGGQNLIGDEQGIELGLIRTQELLSARRIDGGEQFFTRAYDFGFSKSTEEALRIWDKEKILSDAVWVIRKFQPDVIITRFPPDSRAGHGHHSASAVLAREAFDAAADPNRFPEQFQYGVKPWQAKRLLWNTFSFGNINTTDSTQFTIDAGGYNPLLGKSYGELAGESRSQHKSQGFGVPRGRGSQLEYFSTTVGDKPRQELTDDVDISWKRVDGSGKIDKQIDKILGAYKVAQPEASVLELATLLKMIEKLPDSHWKQIKKQETENIIRLCAGLYAEATTNTAFAYQGDSLNVMTSIVNRSALPVTLQTIQLIKQANDGSKIAANATSVNAPLKDDKVFTQVLSQFLDKQSSPISQPYWLLKEKQTGYYNVDKQTLIGQPDVTPAFIMEATVNIAGVEIPVRQPVQYKSNDPVKGEQYQPLVVVPQMELQFGQDNYMALNEKPVGVVAYARSKTSDTATYAIFKNIPDSWASSTASFKYIPKENDGLFDTSMLVPMPNRINTSATFSLSTRDGFAGYKRVIQYDHIPTITYFNTARTHLLNLDIKTVGKNIGYIDGAGDKVAEDLLQLGYNVVKLKEENMSTAYLAQFDAIITGVRAYNVHQWLTDKYDVLMNYVRNGGNLIAQYNTNSNVGPLKAKMAPYNMDIGRNRITDETAVVNFTLPEHPVLNYPNKISSKDFEGWIQERSIYHAEKLDSHFATPLSMADPNEQASNGALAIAPYGKGNFVYTGLVFFRELPAGVPGAYRLMANLIALPKN